MPSVCPKGGTIMRKWGLIDSDWSLAEKVFIIGGTLLVVVSVCAISSSMIGTAR
jgi:hypothetical protein